MAVHVEIGLVVGRQRLRDLIERALELRRDGRRVRREGHARGDVEQDVVALALHLDAGAGGLLAQLALLPVHIGADRAAGDRADARADDLLRPVAPAAEHVAGQITAEHADTGADRRLGHALLAGHRIGGAGGGAEQGGDDGEADEALATGDVA